MKLIKYIKGLFKAKPLTEEDYIRPMSILLTMVLEEVQERDSSAFTGLCSIIGNMECECKINIIEYHTLMKYIKEHRPKESTLMRYWWGVGDKKPRIKWLKELIALN